MTNNQSSVTVHCLVKNEEVFIRAALLSVIHFADQIIIFDTGSTDKTVEIIQDVQKQYREKVIFEEKGVCDKKQHTALRQEMVDRTKTEWFFIVDGDEVWSEQGIAELKAVLSSRKNVECVMAPFYLCVGDVYHQYRQQSKISMLGVTDYFYPRIIKKVRNVHWRGDYNEDTLVDGNEEIFFTRENTVILQNRFWHLTHLVRSSKDNEDYSSGGTRLNKRKLTYFIIGKRINSSVPSLIAAEKPLSVFKSFINFLVLLKRKII